jgi:putative ABC transport system substrate-binding protein
MGKKVIRLALGAVLLALSFPAEAQQPKKVPRIGILRPTSPPDPLIPFLQGLRDLGYVEGKNIHIEYRYAEGKLDRLPELAAELVGLKVDVIVVAANPSVEAAKKATRTIPIVMALGTEPVESGLIASLARPGGNVTGLATLNPELAGKRLEILKEAVPGLSRVAVLRNANNPITEPQLRETRAAAQALRIELQLLEVRGPKDLESAFQAGAKGRVGAVIVLADFMAREQQKNIVALSAKSRLAAMYPNGEAVIAGGLMSYGADNPDMHRRAATYVDKILKGTKPEDLPVERPMKFEFIINLKAAKQIGLTIPPNLLARADRVIK